MCPERLWEEIVKTASTRGKCAAEGTRGRKVITCTNVSRETRGEEPVNKASSRSKCAAEGTRGGLETNSIKVSRDARGEEAAERVQAETSKPRRVREKD